VFQILDPPSAPSAIPLIIFYTLPLGAGLVVVTIATIVVCQKVYRQQRASRRWSTRQNMKLTRKVFWQSFWYMVAFYVTLPFALFSYYWKFKSVHDIWILVIVGFIHPSQGIMNSLVYFQRSSSMEFQDLFLVKQARRMSRGISNLVVSAARRSTEFVIEGNILQQPQRDSTHSGESPGAVVSFDEGAQKSLAISAKASSCAVQNGRDTTGPQSTAEEKQHPDMEPTEGSSSFQYPPSFHQDSMEGGGDEETMAPSHNRSPGEEEWAVGGEPWRRMPSNITEDSDFGENNENMFEAAREHWRLNFTDFEGGDVPLPGSFREADSFGMHNSWFRLLIRHGNSQHADASHPGVTGRSPTSDKENLEDLPSSRRLELRKTGSWFLPRRGLGRNNSVR